MKVAAAIAAVVILGLLGWYLASPKPDGSDLSDKSDLSDRPPPTTTLTDGVDVFQKAFWKRPTPNDQILHAERREWADGNGVKKWQWFIVVKPSPELVKHLRDDNAFGLGKAPAAAPGDDAPDWFQFDPAEVDVLQSASGGMKLAFGKDGKVLYATDSGGGFRPGAPTPIPAAAPETPPSGRLPTTPPPKPRVREPSETRPAAEAPKSL